MSVERGEAVGGGTGQGGGGDNGDVPACLQCPECKKLLQSAVLMPCCQTCLCRPCAFKKLAVIFLTIHLKKIFLLRKLNHT